jgi:hypothetical protein
LGLLAHLSGAKDQRARSVHHHAEGRSGHHVLRASLRPVSYFILFYFIYIYYFVRTTTVATPQIAPDSMRQKRLRARCLLAEPCPRFDGVLRCAQGASNSLGSSSSSARQSVRSAPQSTNAFALDPAKLTACEPQVSRLFRFRTPPHPTLFTPVRLRLTMTSQQVLLSLIREYCRVHIRLFPTSTQRALASCLGTIALPSHRPLIAG